MDHTEVGASYLLLCSPQTSGKDAYRAHIPGDSSKPLQCHNTQSLRRGVQGSQSPAYSLRALACRCSPALNTKAKQFTCLRLVGNRGPTPTASYTRTPQKFKRPYELQRYYTQPFRISFSATRISRASLASTSHYLKEIYIARKRTWAHARNLITRRHIRRAL